MPAAAAVSSPLITPQTAQLVGYGLIFGAAAITGKLMIDALVGDMDAAKAKREFIGPVYQAPKKKSSDKSTHEHLSDTVRFVAMVVSAYSMIAELPKLVQQWGAVEAQIKQVLP